MRCRPAVGISKADAVSTDAASQYGQRLVKGQNSAHAPLAHLVLYWTGRKHEANPGVSGGAAAHRAGLLLKRATRVLHETDNPNNVEAGSAPEQS